MPIHYPHLNIQTANKINIPDEKRILDARQNVWIGYGVANDILSELDDLVLWPRNSRMPSKLIVGDTNNGKSMLLKHFEANHPCFYDKPEEELDLHIPVITIQAPPQPSERLLYSTILQQVWAPHNARESSSNLLKMVTDSLRNLHVRVLVIDEIHHLLSGSHNKQLQFLNVIKYLSNELKLSIVAAGTKDAVRAINVDPQLANRFTALQIPKWKLNKEFLRLLVTFEQVLPLKKASNLASETLAPAIFDMSEGIIGEVAMLLSESAVKAIRNNDEKITPKTLNAINWIPPSQRKRKAMDF